MKLENYRNMSIVCKELEGKLTKNKIDRLHQAMYNLIGDEECDGEIQLYKCKICANKLKEELEFLSLQMYKIRNNKE